MYSKTKIKRKSFIKVMNNKIKDKHIHKSKVYIKSKVKLTQ